MRTTILGSTTLAVAATLALTQLAPASADSIGVTDPKDLAHGADLEDAADDAAAFVGARLAASSGWLLGRGRGPVSHLVQALPPTQEEPA